MLFVKPLPGDAGGRAALSSGPHGLPPWEELSPKPQPPAESAATRLHAEPAACPPYHLCRVSVKSD